MVIEIIFWVLLLDSIIANTISWSGCKEKFDKYIFFRRYFPITRGWTTAYLILVLFIGYLIFYR